MIKLKKIRLHTFVIEFVVAVIDPVMVSKDTVTSIRTHYVE